VASPICMPNRASFLTGRMPSVHGLRYNGCHLPQSANTFVDVLAAGGYDTASIGKSHVQPFLSRPPIAPPSTEGRLIQEAWQEDDCEYDQEHPKRYRQDQRYDVSLPYYGFQFVDMVTDHGDRCGGHYQQWFRDNCPNWESMLEDDNELSHNYSCPQAYRTPIPEEYYPTRYIADRAIDWLHEHDKSRPFFSFVSFPDPHHPFNPPGKYWDMYSPDQFELTLPYEAHHNPTVPMQWMTENWKTGGKQLTQQTAMRVDDQHAKEAMALTAGMISMIDDQVGRVIEALKATDEYENTVIIYNSDHGDYLGDFNLLLKGALPFRSVTQVPMLWSDPQDRVPGESKTLASTIDIGASILSRAGLQPYHGMQGRSFMPTITDNEIHRDELLVEYNDSAARLGFNHAARMRTLLTTQWRYTIYAGEAWGELYDLIQDPNETNNLWDNEKHKEVQAYLSNRLNHHLTAQMDESPASTRLA